MDSEERSEHDEAGSDSDYPLAEPLDTRGTIYFIGPEDGAVKIGFTAGDVRGRISTIQTSQWQRLHLWGTVRGTRRQEQSLHVVVSHLHLSGEWFTRDRPMGELLDMVGSGQLQELLDRVGDDVEVIPVEPIGEVLLSADMRRAVDAWSASRPGCNIVDRADAVERIMGMIVGPPPPTIGNYRAILNLFKSAEPRL